MRRDIIFMFFRRSIQMKWDKKLPMNTNFNNNEKKQNRKREHKSMNAMVVSKCSRLFIIYIFNGNAHEFEFEK